MTYDALSELRRAGHPVDLLPEGQREVLSELNENEVALLNSIRARLEDAAAEVEGQDLKYL